MLPLLGFAGTIIFTCANLVGALAEFEGIVTIIFASSEPLSSLRLPVAMSLLGGGAIILSAGYCLVLAWQRARSLTTFATAHYAILVIATLIEVWADSVLQIKLQHPGDPTIIQEMVRVFVGAAIWIPYFHFSKRVRNTFTVDASARTSLA